MATMTHAEPAPDLVFDGGSMDCGSGLILLIRQHIMQVPEGGILEIRSSEPTVTAELPPWCRMVGHDYLQTQEPTVGHWRHFVRRGQQQAEEQQKLELDRQKAQAYQWRVRGKGTRASEISIYARNFSWKLGHVISFEEKDDLPTSFESFLGSIVGELASGFSTACERAGVIIDELELTIMANLNNVLVQFAMEDGDPSIRSMQVSAFVSSPATSAQLQTIWNETLRRSPVWQTLAKACDVSTRLMAV